MSQSWLLSLTEMVFYSSLVREKGPLLLPLAGNILRFQGQWIPEMVLSFRGQSILLSLLSRSLDLLIADDIRKTTSPPYPWSYLMHGSALPANVLYCWLITISNDQVDFVNSRVACMNQGNTKAPFASLSFSLVKSDRENTVWQLLAQLPWPGMW